MAGNGSRVYMLDGYGNFTSDDRILEAISRGSEALTVFVHHMNQYLYRSTFLPLPLTSTLPKEDSVIGQQMLLVRSVCLLSSVRLMYL